MALFFFAVASVAWAMEDSLSQTKSAEKPRYLPYALVDLYYANTWRKSDNIYHSPLFQNYNTLGQVAINQIILGFQVSAPRYSAHLGLHAGTYLADAYADEPQILRYIRYADVGVALTRAGKLWLNAGVFKAPYGLESPIPAENWTLSYPIISSESPFYQTGVRLAWSGWKNWHIALWLLNGWGRIQKLSHNSLPSWSLSIAYSRPKKFEFAYNNFIGTDDPDLLRRMRYYQEAHASFHLNSKFSWAVMLAVGMQQQAKGSGAYHYWGGAELVARYLCLSSLILAGRMEYFQDRHGVIITHAELPGTTYAHIYGPALNLDYQPFSHLKLRAELKYLFSPVAVFKYIDDMHSRHRLQYTLAISWHL